MEVLMKIEKNLEAGMPEAMRVIHEDNVIFMVQSFSDHLDDWLTQAEWLTAREALRDCANWYLGRE